MHTQGGLPHFCRFCFGEESGADPRRILRERNFPRRRASDTLSGDVSGDSTDAAALAARDARGAQVAGVPESARCSGRLRSEDQVVFVELVDAWQDRIYNAMHKMTGNAEDAADLTQETFARAWAGFGSFRRESSPSTWLFRIAINMAMTRHRQNRRRRTFVAGQLAGGDDGPHDVLDGHCADGPIPSQVVETRERDAQVIAALARLDEPQRQLLILRDIEGMEYQQIADVLEVPLGTLKSRLFRARLALRDQLQDYFGNGAGEP